MKLSKLSWTWQSLPGVLNFSNKLDERMFMYAELERMGRKCHGLSVSSIYLKGPKKIMKTHSCIYNLLPTPLLLWLLLLLLLLLLMLLTLYSCNKTMCISKLT